MLFVILANAAVFITGIAFVMTIINLRLLRSPKPWAPTSPQDGEAELVSVCVPARNEEANLGECVRRILANDYPNLEVLVYDDQSTDATPRIIAEMQAADARVRAVNSVPLPTAVNDRAGGKGGWNGKQHACWRMSQAARGRWLVFTDADVRFEPGCVSAARGAAAELDAALVSMFPRQVTGTLAESLAVPMIFFILLSYLPFPQMRKTMRVSASAGCGQFLMVRRDAYDAAGGHEAFKDSMHDGIKLPRAVRQAGFKTDLFDGTAFAHVRMYHGLASTWRGFAKNAFEGLGSLGLLLFITITHLVGHVLPWMIVLVAAATAVLGLLGVREGPAALRWLAENGLFNPMTIAGSLIAMAVAVEQRMRIAKRTKTSLGVILLHPVAVLMMTAIQWHSWWLHITGARTWRGRTMGVVAESGAGAGGGGGA